MLITIKECFLKRMLYVLIGGACSRAYHGENELPTQAMVRCIHELSKQSSLRARLARYRRRS